MSKKITLQVPIEVTVRDRDVRLLACVARHLSRSGRAHKIPLTVLANDLGTSPATCRRAIAACRDEGYLDVQENRLSNGAQQENSYRLSREGRAILDAARTANLVA